MKMRFKKTISLMLVICFIFSYMPQVFAFEKKEAPMPGMTPLQDLRKNQAQEEKEEEVYEELTPEEQEILDEINNNPIVVPTTEEGTGTIGDIQSTDTVSPLIKDEELETMATTSTSTVTDEGFRVEPVASVYNVLNNNNDYVSQATGALTYEKTLLSLPGVNGLDLNLSVRYNSDEALITKNEFGVETFDNVRKTNFNKFATGWSFGFPTIIKSDVKNNYWSWKKETHLQFPDGSAYEIKNDDDYLTQDLTLTLEQYKLSDMSLTRKAESKNYELLYSDGTLYTFDGTFGNLIQIKDRFGNEINFDYEEYNYYRGSFLDYIFRPSYYEATIKALTKITDSAGRVINIDYDIETTSHGKEVKGIQVKMNDVVYADLKTKRIPANEGSADILESITDANGYTTKFSYEEDTIHIYDYNTYSVYGSEMLLAKIDLPTGGWSAYEYEKARRKYSYVFNLETYSGWYEVYKVSKVSDSSGYERTYEYQNDRSGYPYENPVTNYSCIMKEGSKITVSTFNYQHNKVKEQIFDEGNTQNDYIVGNGQSKWRVVVGDYVYHMGYLDVKKYQTYFYKQNIHSGETTILNPCKERIFNTSVLKSSNNRLFIFQKSTVGFYVSEYDTLTDTWSDGGRITTIVLPYVLDGLQLNNMYYKDSKFHMGYLRMAEYRFHSVVYDPAAPVEERWTYTDSDGSTASGYNINNGYEINGKMFTYDTSAVYESDPETNTISNSFYYYSSENLRPHIRNNVLLFAAVLKGADGNLYFVTQNSNIYRFEPDNAGDKFVFVGNKQMTLTASTIFSAGSPQTPTLLFVSDGIEKVKLYEPETPQNTTVVTTTYNTLNQPVSNTITRINGSQKIETGTESYTYVEGKSNLLSSTDIEGNKTTYIYDSTYYLPTKVTQYADTSNAIITDYELTDDKKSVATATVTYDDVCLKTDYTYDAKGNVLTESLSQKPTSGTYSSVGIKEYTYTENGSLVGAVKQSEIKTNNSDFTLTDAEDITVTYTYNNLGQLEYETDSLGRTKAYVYTEGGLPYEDWYTNGSVKEYFYQINGNRYGGENIITNRYTGYHEGEYICDYITFEYLDDLGRVIQQSEKDPNGAETILVTYEYTGHNLTKTTDANGNYTLYDYDAFDRVTETNAYDKDFNHLNQTTITYDDFNLTRTVNNSGKISKTYYDKLGRVIKEEVQTDAGLATTQTEYDYMGNVVKTIDPKGNETNYSYNDRGLLLNVAKTFTVDEQTLNDVTSYTYDALGNTLTVTNNDRLVQTNTYDSLNRLLTTTDAMGYNDNCWNMYQYDAGGRVVKSKDKNGNITTYSYKENTDYLENRTAGNNVTSYTYDDWGNMLTATNSTGTYEYKYKFNNLLERIKTPDNKAVVYTYDNNHNITKVKDYSGNVLNYTYNGLNKIDTVKRNSVVIADYDYYNFGALQKVTYPNQGSSEYTYDNDLRLVAQTNRQADGSPTNEYTFTYDLNGNQTVKNDSSDITTYTYDEFNRLTSSTDPYGNTTYYQFDLYGNIERKYVENAELGTYCNEKLGIDVDNVWCSDARYGYDANNRLTDIDLLLDLEDNSEINIIETYQFDNNGNLTEKEEYDCTVPDEAFVETYTYNELNQLTAYNNGLGETTTYSYAPDGMRRSKTRNNQTTKFYWDRGYISAESVNNTFTAKNYIGAQGIFARESGNTTEYMLKNGHGDVTNILQNGEVSNWLDYDPYGNQTMGNTTNPFRYCGEYFDEESGLIYLRNRYYNPEIGRFITEDPAKDGLNWYAYCGNNPVNFWDPSGESATAAFVVGGALIGGFVGALSQISINITNGNEWHKGVIASTIGGAVYGTVFATTLNVATASYASAASTAVINAGVAIYNGETPQKAIHSAVTSTLVDGTLSFVINKGVGAFIKTNNGWIQPQRLLSFFGKSYGQKIMQQTVAAGAINVASVTLLKNGKPVVTGIQQLVGVDDDGIYGPKTQAAVKEFQRELIAGGYLPSGSDDGIWGQQTDDAFRKYVNNNVSFTSVN